MTGKDLGGQSQQRRGRREDIEGVRSTARRESILSCEDGGNRAREAKPLYHVVTYCQQKYKSFGCWRIRKARKPAKSGPTLSQPESMGQPGGLTDRVSATRQLPYWFEEGLLSFLREGDILRVRKQDLFSEASKNNPFCLEILALIDEAQQTHADLKPWLKLSWRQFLFWFADVETCLTDGVITSSDLLSAGDASWKKLDKAKVFMEERDNDGTWIRDWLNVITEFQAIIH